MVFYASVPLKGPIMKTMRQKALFIIASTVLLGTTVLSNAFAGQLQKYTVEDHLVDVGENSTLYCGVTSSLDGQRFLDFDTYQVETNLAGGGHVEMLYKDGNVKLFSTAANGTKRVFEMSDVMGVNPKIIQMAGDKLTEDQLKSLLLHAREMKNFCKQDIETADKNGGPDKYPDFVGKKLPRLSPDVPGASKQAKSPKTHLGQGS